MSETPKVKRLIECTGDGYDSRAIIGIFDVDSMNPADLTKQRDRRNRELVYASDYDALAAEVARLRAEVERLTAKREMWFVVVEDHSEFRHRVQTVFAPHEPVEILGEIQRWESWDQEAAASAAADHYYHNCDGHVSKWPLTFALFATKDGPELARVCVECELEPTFNGRVVKQKGGV
jgi:hypothetical protein